MIIARRIFHKSVLWHKNKLWIHGATNKFVCLEINWSAAIKSVNISLPRVFISLFFIPVPSLTPVAFAAFPDLLSLSKHPHSFNLINFWLSRYVCSFCSPCFSRRFFHGHRIRTYFPFISWWLALTRVLFHLPLHTYNIYLISGCLAGCHRSYDYINAWMNKWIGIQQLTSPVSSTSCKGGESCTVSWIDNGDSPSLSEFGNSRVAIFVGSQNSQTMLQEIVADVNVETTSTISFTVDPNMGENSSQ